MKRIFALSLLLITALLTGSCSRKKTSDPIAQLSRSWKNVSVLDDAGTVFKKVDERDTLIIHAEKTFSYHLHKENIHASGTWEYHDSTLIFTYDAPFSLHNVDSIQLKKEGRGGKAMLFSSGKAIAGISSTGLEPELLTRAFRIKVLTDDKLVFVENGITFSYSYRAPVTEGSLSMMSIGRGLLGLAVLVLITWLFSVDKRRVPWKLVLSGIALQFIIAIGVLKVEWVKEVFEVFGNFFVVILSFTQEGSEFVFGDMVRPGGSLGFVFAFQILPTIIFFSALTSLLFYLGVLQKIVYGLAWVMSKTMKLSGAESLAAAANIFLGQTEAPLLIKPYIGGMTKSELLCLMSGGMATIAGGVMAAYIGFLGGDDPAMRLFFAKHLLAASIMSAPAAIVAAKILIPQTEEVDKTLVVSKDKIGKNLLEALSIGTGEGLRLAVNVGAMLLVFIAVIAMVNYILKDLIGDYSGLNALVSTFTGGRYEGLTMQFLLGYACAPLAWIMGVCREDMVLVGQLLGEKTILNEFVAYASLGQMKDAAVFSEQKSIIIATYILCGFANFASIGIQIGGIGSLAPEKRTALSELGFRALLGGTMASLFTAVIVGMLI